MNPLLRHLPLLILLGAGCGETGLGLVSYPAALVGAGAGQRFDASGWSVRLDAARMAIGPIYFCATEAASMDLCPTAVNELTEVVAVDPLSPNVQALGMVTGSTGTIRSVTYDLGITWFTRQTSATPSDAAPGGHSARFEGQASRGAQSLRFVAEVDLIPSSQGTLAVQGTRVGPVALVDGRQRLEVRVDPTAWIAGLDFDELAAIGGDPVLVTPTTRSYNRLALAITLGEAPTFTWFPTE